MNFQTVYFDIKITPILKALAFHFTCLILVMIGIYLQLKTVDVKVITDINLIYVVFLALIPVSVILISATTKYSKEILPKDPTDYYRPRCVLKEYFFILTFKHYYKHASNIKSIALYVLSFFYLMACVIAATKYPQFPFLWFMGLFFLIMILRYQYIFESLKKVKITVCDQGVLLPFFNLGKVQIIKIPWDTITQLDIIGSEKDLISIDPEECVTIQDNINFIRGMIIHYEQNNEFKRCVITDRLLSAKMLWGFYNCCKNYVDQKDDKIRIAYGSSSVKLHWEDEVPNWIIFFARYRLSAALKLVKQNAKKRIFSQ